MLDCIAVATLIVAALTLLATVLGPQGVSQLLGLSPIYVASIEEARQHPDVKKYLPPETAEVLAWVAVRQLRTKKSERYTVLRAKRWRQVRRERQAYAGVWEEDVLMWKPGAGREGR